MSFYDNYLSFNSVLLLSSPIGTLGQSSIDKKPDSFIEFDKIIQDKNWIYKLGSDAEDEERDKILAELAQHIADGEDLEAQSPETELGSHGSPSSNLAITGQGFNLHKI